MIAEMVTIKTLDDVCHIFNGSTPLRSEKKYWENGTINWFTIDDIRSQGREINYTRQKVTSEGLANTSMKVLPPETVLVCCTASVGEYAITNIELTTNQQFNGLVVKDKLKLSPKYLFHFASTLKDQLLSVSGKTTIDFVSMTKLKSVQIPIPPLPEQERIVAKLDAAFAAIDAAKANVERNLHNAKELFQSKLNEVFSQKGDGWVEKKLSECIRLKSGDGLTAKDMVAGGYPVYGGNGIAGHHDAFNLEGSNVIIGRVGALCGNARYVNEPIWLTDNAFKVSDFLAEFNHEFLTLLLNYCDLRSYARQAAQPVVSNSSMKDVPLAFPKSVEEQTILVGKFESLREVLTSATTNYTHKLTELETLKKSLLERAFRGEL